MNAYARTENGGQLQFPRKWAEKYRPFDRQQLRNLLHPYLNFAARDEFGDTATRSQRGLRSYRVGDSK